MTWVLKKSLNDRNLIHFDLFSTTHRPNLFFNQDDDTPLENTHTSRFNCLIFLHFYDSSMFFFIISYVLWQEATQNNSLLQLSRHRYIRLFLEIIRKGNKEIVRRSTEKQNVLVCWEEGKNTEGERSSTFTTNATFCQHV